MEGEETKFCTNCKRDISTANFVMHEMHCRRHIVLCDVCDEPIPRSELDQHFNDVHQKVPCELCKREIEKDKMEDHMENSCLKKQMHCEHCELSFPKDGFDAHVDYCGSRTECCELCQQYIMLKDMTQHEVSGCTYPEPKPAAASSSSSHTSTGAAPPDPFSMSYLQEFLASDLGRMSSHVPSNTQRLQQARHGRDRPPRAGGNRTRPTQQASRGRQSTRNNKSNVNSERERGNQTASTNFLQGSGVDLPPDMDYDTMLALQLAHEDMVNNGADGNLNLGSNVDNEDNGLNYQWQHFSERDIGGAGTTQIQTDQHSTEDDMTIPCEGCNLEIPVDMYIEHTEYCMEGSEVNNVVTSTSTNEPRDRNNAMPVTTDNLRPSIPVIDNLHQPTNPLRMLADSSAFDNEEDFCLPCEFCDEVYPSELILQHQVVCPLNSSATPRATTPATSGLRSSARRRDKDKDNNQVRAAFGHNNVSTGAFGTGGFGSFGGDHPGMGDNRDDNDDDDDDDDDGPTSNFFRDESYKNSLQSISDKYGDSPTTDRASYFSTMGTGRRNSNNRDTEEDEGPPRTYEPPRTNRSAQRARARLSQFLQEPDSQGSQRSSNHSNSNSFNNTHHRRGAAAAAVHSTSTFNNATGTTSSSRGRKTRGVDARTVIREVNREAARGSQNGVTSPIFRSRIYRSNTNPSNGTSPTNPPRNRQRSDHVFSPELRPKPSDNRRR